MIRSRLRIRLCAVLIVLILCFIWGNSLLPAEKSQAFSDWVKEILSALFSGESAGEETGSGLLRKIAHFSEFAALGMCLCWLFGMLQKSCFWSFACGFGAACVDETIQRFVPDRGPSLIDVGIDSCGVAAGMMLLLIGHDMVRKSNQLKENSL